MLSAGALRSKPLFGVLLLLGAVRFLLTGMYEAAIGGSGLERASGWLGLPLGRRGRARTSLEGGLERQIDQAEPEPGVRRQL